MMILNGIGIGLILFTVVATVPAVSAQNLVSRFTDPYHDGYVLVLWGNGDQESEILQRLGEIKLSGARHVTLMVPGCQTDIYSSDVGHCEHRPFRPQVLRAAQLAKELGLELSFLPLVGTLKWDWRGFFDPIDVAQWFETYTRWLVPLAKEAQQLGHQEFVVGTEFSKLYRYEKEWRNLIAKVREVFKGALILTANWDDLNHGFWQDLDAIGISAYRPITLSENPSLAELINGWAKIKQEWLSLSRKWNRPLHFTEVGYAAVKSAASKPWHVGPESVQDQALQALCFEAFKQTWESEARLIRTTVWAVSNPFAAEYALGFETLRKPGQKPVEAFFSARQKLSSFLQHH